MQGLAEQPFAEQLGSRGVGDWLEAVDQPAEQLPAGRQAHVQRGQHLLVDDLEQVAVRSIVITIEA